jgi:predicted MFS family arabinose efflux permease
MIRAGRKGHAGQGTSLQMDQGTVPHSGLDEQERKRGRRLAVLSHPAGMTHRNVFTDQLPTLALVGLGASEAWIGLQRAFEPLSQLLQLPTLRAVGRLRMRSILVGGQLVAVLAGLPLVAYAALRDGGAGGLAVALASLWITAVGIVISQTVWFPLLRSYVEPGRIGEFFGVLRTGWHLTLIAYFLLAQRWLEAHPGGFGVLFGVATAAGILRMLLIVRLPEPPPAPEARVRIRAALSLLSDHAPLRRYLAGMILFGAPRRAALPFAVVMMRRSMGLSDADVMLTTVASFAGGFASLYAWGRAVDRFGAAPVFRGTALVSAALLVALALVGPGASLLAMIGFFFVFVALASGFGVADTHVLFGLAPERDATATLVVADVTTSLAYGAAPFLVGVALDAAIANGIDATSAYRTLFAAAALVMLLAPLPLRGFRR